MDLMRLFYTNIKDQKSGMVSLHILIKDKLEDAFTFCSMSMKTLHAHIEEIAIITTIVEIKSCVNAPTVHSISLNKLNYNVYK